MVTRLLHRVKHQGLCEPCILSALQSKVIQNYFKNLVPKWQTDIIVKLTYVSSWKSEPSLLLHNF